MRLEPTLLGSTTNRMKVNTSPGQSQLVSYGVPGDNGVPGDKQQRGLTKRPRRAEESTSVLTSPRDVEHLDRTLRRDDMGRDDVPFLRRCRRQRHRHQQDSPGGWYRAAGAVRASLKEGD